MIAPYDVNQLHFHHETTIWLWTCDTNIRDLKISLLGIKEYDEKWYCLFLYVTKCTQVNFPVEYLYLEPAVWYYCFTMRLIIVERLFYIKIASALPLYRPLWKRAKGPTAVVISCEQCIVLHWMDQHNYRLGFVARGGSAPNSPFLYMQLYFCHTRVWHTKINMKLDASWGGYIYQSVEIWNWCIRLNDTWECIIICGSFLFTVYIKLVRIHKK